VGVVATRIRVGLYLLVVVSTTLLQLIEMHGLSFKNSDILTNDDRAKKKKCAEIKISYDEYVKASVFIGCRVNSFTRYGLPAIDSVMVKWYVHEVLGCTSDSAEYRPACDKIEASMDKMIFDKLLKVATVEHAGKMRLRVLEVDGDFIPESLMVQMLDGVNPLSIRDLTNCNDAAE